MRWSIWMRFCAMRSSPAKLKAEADSGDHIHPNDAGNQTMADAFDLGVFKQ